MPNPIRCWAASGSSICAQLYIGVLRLLPTATQSYWSGLGSSQSIHYWSCWQYPFTLACTTKSFYWLYNNNTQYFQVLQEGTQDNIFTYYVTWDFGRFHKGDSKCLAYQDCVQIQLVLMYQYNLAWLTVSGTNLYHHNLLAYSFLRACQDIGALFLHFDVCEKECLPVNEELAKQASFRLQSAMQYLLRHSEWLPDGRGELKGWESLLVHV